MAVKSYTIDQITPTTMSVTWRNLQNGDTGEPLPTSQWSVVAFEISGMGGAGGALDLQTAISANPAVWSTGSGFTTFPTFQTTSREVNGGLRPAVLNGDGTTDLDITVTLMPYGKNI